MFAAVCDLCFYFCCIPCKGKKMFLFSLCSPLLVCALPNPVFPSVRINISAGPGPVGQCYFRAGPVNHKHQMRPVDRICRIDFPFRRGGLRPDRPGISAASTGLFRICKPIPFDYDRISGPVRSSHCVESSGSVRFQDCQIPHLADILLLSAFRILRAVKVQFSAFACRIICCAICRIICRMFCFAICSFIC